MTESAGLARIFFALWPAPDIQRALGEVAARRRQECGGRAIPAGNIHLTLLFLGNIPRDRLAQLKTIGGGARAGRFELSVDRVEYWRHNRIVWAGVAECPAALPSLVEQLSRAVSEEGLQVERRPYVPHVTLIRDARRAPAESAISAIAWPVTSFALIESVARGGGRRYQVLREWPLIA